MKIEYDTEADALYILIREANVEDNIDMRRALLLILMQTNI